VDNLGTWAQDHANACEWRDESVLCDLTNDSDLPDCIVDALSKLENPVECISTYTDDLLPAVAKAAVKMGLHMNPPEAFDIAHDKNRSRKLCPPANVQAFSVKCENELAEILLRDFCGTPLKCPLTVKPTDGVSSGGVIKATSQMELFGAVQ
jgi:hypothetical protein